MKHLIYITIMLFVFCSTPPTLAQRTPEEVCNYNPFIDGCDTLCWHGEGYINDESARGGIGSYYQLYAFRLNDTMFLIEDIYKKSDFCNSNEGIILWKDFYRPPYQADWNESVAGRDKDFFL